jgi:glycosyltransferase involved in cell wall biosynthesis
VALRPDPSSPRASVVVPAYHSDATIGSLLDGLRAQTYGDFELIVVNSSEEGRTERIVREKLPEARFEQSPRRLLPHAARNRGVEVARGSLLAFTDPDCVPEPTWLERLVAASDRGHGVVVGAMGLLDTSAYARAVHLCKFAHWLPGASEGHRAIAPTANALYTREAWDAIGPFRADSFSSDTLHSWRAAQLGFRPWFEPTAIVSHHHDGTPRSFLAERHLRGEDFARLRASEGGHSRGWAAARLVTLPAVPLVELARVGVSAGRAGWGRTFAATAPLQLAANTAWAIGEARAYARLLRAGPAAR